VVFEMAGPMCDCYVLAQSRSAETALAFLDRFLPQREPTWDPADPADVLGIPAGVSVADILDFLVSHPAKSYTFYWSNVRSEAPYYAILAFNQDASLVLGLSCEEESQQAERWLAEMRAFTSSDHGYWGLEEPPAGSSKEFLQRVGLSE
jgi:hypothetical protein